MGVLATVRKNSKSSTFVLYMYGNSWQTKQPTASLYQFVFDTRWLRFIVIFMMSFFVLHPAMPAFASEEVATDQGEEVSELSDPAVGEDDDVSEVEDPPAEELADIELENVSMVTEAADGSSYGNSAATTEEKVEDTTAALDDADEENSNGQSGEVSPETSMTDVATEEVNEVSTAGVELVVGTTSSPVVEQVASTTDLVSESGVVTDNSETATSSEVYEQVGTSTPTILHETGGSSDPAQSTTSDATATSSTQDDAPVDDSEEASAADSDVSSDVDISGASNEPEAESESATTTPLSAETATTSKSMLVTASTSKVTTVTRERGEYDFSPSECVAVADGSYYCSRAVPAQPDSVSSVDWVVKALPDSDGDLEVYYYDGDELLQVTSNGYDDAAPHYDALSHTIVWHALVNDRYQIFTYDIQTEEIAQLTHSATNNMEPGRHGEHIVWQRWVENNWEVILLHDGEEKQLTSNTYHDVLPDVQDGHVVWSSQPPGADPQVTVHELTSGTQAMIPDADGGQVVNPRFVLIYDTEFANGDLVTKGFDPETGRLITLAAQPADAPPEIPDSDQTGETRALIQNKPTRENTEEETLAPTAPEKNDETASSSPQVATDMDALQVATSTVVLDDGSVNLSLTEYDIIVEPLAATTTSATASTTGQ